MRQSRPGHPGVGRFGSCFPRRSPDPEDRTFFRRVPATDRLGYGRRAVSRPAPDFTHPLWHRRRVDPAVPRIFGTPAVLAHMGRYWGRFPTSHLGRHGESRYRHAAFMAFFYDLFTHWSGTSGSRRSVSRPHEWSERLLSAFPPVCVVTTAPRRAFGPRVIRPRIRPLAGAECAPNSNRGRTAGAVCKRRIPGPRPHPSVPCASCGCGKSLS